MNHFELIQTFINHYNAGRALDMVSTINNEKPFDLSFSHLFHSLNSCRVHNGFQGKRVLEMGGALPSKYVSEILQAKYWAAVEYQGYTENQFSNKNIINSSNYTYNNNGWKSFYEYWKDSSQEKFDVVYSISAFEHIYDLGSCIDAMYDMLNNDGQLYSTFTPIWSAGNGSHGFFPKFLDSRASHGHLMYDFISLQNYLITSHSISASVAYKYAHDLYKSDQINRYSYEEYLHIFDHCKFETKNVQAIDMKDFNQLYDNEKCKQINSIYPAMAKSCSGFSILFTKSAD